MFYIEFLKINIKSQNSFREIQMKLKLLTERIHFRHWIMAQFENRYSFKFISFLVQFFKLEKLSLLIMCYKIQWSENMIWMSKYSKGSHMTTQHEKKKTARKNWQYQMNNIRHHMLMVNHWKFSTEISCRTIQAQRAFHQACNRDLFIEVRAWVDRWYILPILLHLC